MPRRRPDRLPDPRRRPLLPRGQSAPRPRPRLERPADPGAWDGPEPCRPAPPHPRRCPGPDRPGRGASPEGGSVTGNGGPKVAVLYNAPVLPAGHADAVAEGDVVAVARTVAEALTRHN